MGFKDRVTSLTETVGRWSRAALSIAPGGYRKMSYQLGPRDNLFVAVLLTALGLAIFGAVAWWLIGFALTGDPTYSMPKSTETRGDATRVALTLVAGLGGAVALVVTYRKQKRAEAGYFLERLSTAAGLLGDTNPTIQVSGIYALAALADENRSERRQQCIDVLCGYLRLPYFPTAAASSPHPAVTTTKRTHAFVDGNAEVQTTINHRPSDGEIRRTILDVIRQHLGPDSRQSWSDARFNFQGATFDGGILSGAVFRGFADFRNAEFIGGTMDFSGTSFSRGVVDFSGATFSGGSVNFDKAIFSGGIVNFMTTRFSGGTVDFDNATFSDGTVNFDMAFFSGGTVSFNEAIFSGGTVSFSWAEFSGGTVSFNEATVSAGTADFSWAEFSGGTVRFNEAKFSGGTINFMMAKVSGGTVRFNEAIFSGATADFSWAVFSGGTVKFNGASFTAGTTDFKWAEFSGGTVNFNEATFVGSTVQFRFASFSGGTVDFRFPLQWSVPPHVPWNHNPPDNVLPQELPFVWHY